MLIAVFHQIGKNKKSCFQGIMSDTIVINTEDIVFYNSGSHCPHSFPIEFYNSLFFCFKISFPDGIVDFRVVCQHNINCPLIEISVEYTQMVTDAVAVSLPGLCNKIAHIHNRGFRSVDSVHDIAHDKMRQNAGVQAAGTANGLCSLRQVPRLLLSKAARFL